MPLNVLSWECREFGEDGWTMIGVDTMLTDGTMIGIRRAIHVFELDNANNPTDVFLTIIREMTETMDRATAVPP